MGGFYAVELLGGVFVSALIKEVLRQQEAHLRHVHVLVVLLEEGPGLCLRVLRLQLQRRHRPDGLRISAAVSLRLLNGLRVESALIVFRGFLQVLGLHLRAHQNQRQCYLYLLHLYLLLSFCFFLPPLLPGSFLFGPAFHPSSPTRSSFPLSPSELFSLRPSLSPLLFPLRPGLSLPSLLPGSFFFGLAFHPPLFPLRPGISPLSLLHPGSFFFGLAFHPSLLLHGLSPPSLLPSFFLFGLAFQPLFSDPVFLPPLFLRGWLFYHPEPSEAARDY